MARGRADPSAMLQEARAIQRARAAGDTPRCVVVPVYLDDSAEAVAAHLARIAEAWPDTMREGEVVPKVIRIWKQVDRPASDPLTFPPPAHRITRSDGLPAGPAPEPVAYRLALSAASPPFAEGEGGSPFSQGERASPPGAGFTPGGPAPTPHPGIDPASGSAGVVPARTVRPALAPMPRGIPAPLNPTPSPASKGAGVSTSPEPGPPPPERFFEQHDRERLLLSITGDPPRRLD